MDILASLYTQPRNLLLPRRRREYRNSQGVQLLDLNIEAYDANHAALERILRLPHTD
jgi:hypothetical protein